MYLDKVGSQFVLAIRKCIGSDWEERFEYHYLALFDMIVYGMKFGWNLQRVDEQIKGRTDGAIFLVSQAFSNSLFYSLFAKPVQGALACREPDSLRRYCTFSRVGNTSSYFKDTFLLFTIIIKSPHR